MAVATYTYDASPPDEQTALPPAEAITAAFTFAGAASGTAGVVPIEGTGTVEDK
ncbi:MAG: hypothetical protein M3Y35_09570 [Actinomycetota bacterium]|nr:hypothetical protein [Actinomycetota bacterium]